MFVLYRVAQKSEKFIVKYVLLQQRQKLPESCTRCSTCPPWAAVSTNSRHWSMQWKFVVQ